MALLAIPWFVLETTGSAARTGVTGFFTFLPIVLAGFLGGPIIDRLGFKRTSVTADVASGLTVALIPLLFHTTGLEFWQLLVLVFVGGFLDTPGEAARISMLGDVAEAAGTSTERAASLEEGISRASHLLGAPIAGVLIGIIGASNVLWVDAGTFGASALLVLFGVPRVRGRKAEPAPYWSDFKESFTFMRGERLVLLVILTLTVTNFLDGALSFVTLPVLAKRIFGDPVALGLIFGVMGGGAVVGSLGYAAIGRRFSRRWVYIGGFIIVALQALAYAAFPRLGVTLVIAAVAGIAAGPINPIIASVLLERVPVELRGRVFGAVKSIAWMALPLGVLAGGYLLEWAGLRMTLLLLGAAYLVATLSLVVNPGSRDLERPVPARMPPPPPPPVPRSYPPPPPPPSVLLDRT